MIFCHIQISITIGRVSIHSLKWLDFYFTDLWLSKCTIWGSGTTKSPKLPDEHRWGTTLWSINSEETIWCTSPAQKHRNGHVSHSHFILFHLVLVYCVLNTSTLAFVAFPWEDPDCQMPDAAPAEVVPPSRCMRAPTKEGWRRCPEQYPGFSHNYLLFVLCHFIVFTLAKSPLKDVKEWNGDNSKSCFLCSSQAVRRYSNVPRFLKFSLGDHSTDHKRSTIWVVLGEWLGEKKRSSSVSAHRWILVSSQNLTGA